jgi:hypothetical protein
VEAEHEVVLGLRLQVADLFSSNNGSTYLLRLSSVSVGTPLDLVDLSLADEGLMEGISLHVRDSQNLIFRGGNKVTFLIPVS